MLPNQSVHTDEEVARRRENKLSFCDQYLRNEMNVSATLVIFVLMVAVATAADQRPPDVVEGCPSRTWEKVGCFKDRKNRALPKMLVNARDRESKYYDGHPLEWNNWNATLYSLACRCAKKALLKGYTVFGLQFYGECWSGPDGEDYSKYGESNNCIMKLQKDDYSCDKNAKHECVGRQWTNYVYRVKENEAETPTDGGYTEWTDWTECTKTCGGGSQVRERSCTNPEPNNGGKDCSELGPSEEVQQCSAAECPPPCEQAIDLVIVLDTSRSIPKSKLPTAKDFVMKIAYAFNVSQAGTRIGLVVYNKKSKVLIRLDNLDKQSPEAVKEALLNETRGWGTNTDKALEETATLFTEGNGDRPDKLNVLIVITDGKNRGGDLAPALDALDDKNVGIYAIGVGKNIDYAELKVIVRGKDGHDFEADDFDELDKKLRSILEASCPQ